MNKKIFPAIILFFITCTFNYCNSTPASKEYFIDASQGNDLNDGRTMSTPWKTVKKVNQSRFNAGDKILFKRGEEWREELTIKFSGEKNNPIIFGAYGEGEKPVIKGSDKVKSFKPQSDNIWNAAWNTEPSWIWFIKDGNINWGNKRDSQNTLSQDFDWYYDGKFLFIYSPSNPIDYYSSIEASSRKHCINAEQRSYIVIEKLHIQFPKMACIKIFENTVVQNCLLEYSGIYDTEKRGDGVWVVGSGNLIAENIIRENASHGVDINPSTYETNNNIVEYNTIYNNYHNNLDIRSAEGGVARNNTIRFNQIFCTEDFNRSSVNGVFLQASFPQDRIIDTEIYNNVVHHQTGSGIHVSRNVDGVSILNNTVYFTRDDNTACFNINNSSGKVVLKNNIGIDGATWIVRLESEVNKIFEGNLYFQSGGKKLLVAKVNGKNYDNFLDYKLATGLDDNSRWVNKLEFAESEESNYKLIDDVNAGAYAAVGGNSNVKKIRIGASEHKKYIE